MEPPTADRSGSPPEVRNWRSCKRVFQGHHPWPTRCVEHSSGHEGAGGGAALVLTKGALGPHDPVRAFFAAAGALVRASCGGWVHPTTGEPALPDRAAIDAAWLRLRRGFERGPYGLAPITAPEYDALLADVCRILGWEHRGDGAIVVRRNPTGIVVVDGRAVTVAETELPVRGPCVGGLAIARAWNERLFLGQTATQFVLVSWSTAA